MDKVIKELMDRNKSFWIFQWMENYFKENKSLTKGLFEHICENYPEYRVKHIQEEIEEFRPNEHKHSGRGDWKNE